MDPAHVNDIVSHNPTTDSLADAEITRGSDGRALSTASSQALPADVNRANVLTVLEGIYDTGQLPCSAGELMAWLGKYGQLSILTTFQDIFGYENGKWVDKASLGEGDLYLIGTCISPLRADENIERQFLDLSAQAREVLTNPAIAPADKIGQLASILRDKGLTNEEDGTRLRLIDQLFDGGSVEENLKVVVNAFLAPFERGGQVHSHFGVSSIAQPPDHPIGIPNPYDRACNDSLSVLRRVIHKYQADDCEKVVSNLFSILDCDISESSSWLSSNILRFFEGHANTDSNVHDALAKVFSHHCSSRLMCGRSRYQENDRALANLNADLTLGVHQLAYPFLSQKNKIQAAGALLLQAREAYLDAAGNFPSIHAYESLARMPHAKKIGDAVSFIAGTGSFSQGEMLDVFRRGGLYEVLLTENAPRTEDQRFLLENIYGALLDTGCGQTYSAFLNELMAIENSTYSTRPPQRFWERIFSGFPRSPRRAA